MSFFRCKKNSKSSAREFKRAKKAMKVAGKRLRRADRYMKNGKRLQFFEQVLKAQWGYLGDRFSISYAKLDRQKVKEEMQKNNIPEKDIKAVFEIISICEFAREAPSTVHADMRKILDQTLNLINTTEEKLSQS